MDRPRREDIDSILRQHHEDELLCNEDVHDCMLAAEVRALRADLQQAQSAAEQGAQDYARIRAESERRNSAAQENARMQESIDLYRVTLARIEALPAKWRQPSPAHGLAPQAEREAGFYAARKASADDLSAALRGEHEERT